MCLRVLDFTAKKKVNLLDGSDLGITWFFSTEACFSSELR